MLLSCGCPCSRTLWMLINDWPGSWRRKKNQPSFKLLCFQVRKLQKSIYRIRPVVGTGVPSPKLLLNVASKARRDMRAPSGCIRAAGQDSCSWYTKNLDVGGTVAAEAHCGLSWPKEESVSSFFSFWLSQTWLIKSGPKQLWADTYWSLPSLHPSLPSPSWAPIMGNLPVQLPSYRRTGWISARISVCVWDWESQLLTSLSQPSPPSAVDHFHWASVGVSGSLEG